VGAEVAIHIEKNLPVQGGMGAGSANAAAALIGLEKELGIALEEAARLGVAAEVGSDVPLFLLGGAVLGTGRGEVVEAMPDLPRTVCLVAVPGVGVSTPTAFREWDKRVQGRGSGVEARGASGLTSEPVRDSLEKLSHAYAFVFGFPEPEAGWQEPGTSGIVPGGLGFQGQDPEKKQGSSGSDGSQGRTGLENDLAENTLLSLVRTGVENDFEEVVFPEYPSLREIKRLLMGEDTGGPALYAALSGSGSALFGLYRSKTDAEAAQQRVRTAGLEFGVKTFLTETLPRPEYWARMFAG
jgi:4-diphosphocytidyl-2-C-methyl-D-erythritol kinase